MEEKKENLINKFFLKEDIEKIKNMTNKGNVKITHPILYILTKNNMISNNTLLAFNEIFDKDKNYYEEKKYKILKETQFEIVNGDLGEVRCYGYLLKAFNNSLYDVVPIPRQKHHQQPDFKIININTNEKICIEVTTKQANPFETEKIQEYLLHINDCNKKNRYCSIAPFGYNYKKYSQKTIASLEDDPAYTALLRFMGIKSESKQLKDINCPGILWIDFQSEFVLDIMNIENFLPIRCKNNEIFSGLFWSAMYGKVGLPIYYGNSFYVKGSRKNYKLLTMDGMFCKRPEVSAIIVSCEKYTLLFENIYNAKYKLPEWFLNEIKKVPNYNDEYSIYY